MFQYEQLDRKKENMFVLVLCVKLRAFHFILRNDFGETFTFNKKVYEMLFALYALYYIK